MSIDITTIGVGVDTSKLKSGTRELDNFGKSADAASRKADSLTKSNQGLAKESGAASLALGRMAGALAAVVSVASLGRTLDEYTKFTAQLKLATRSQNEYNVALSDVNRIANTAQASLSSIGTLYARLNNALRDLGVSQGQVGKITETVGLALKVSGATASESASAMLQLSQAFGSGVLRGEEFNAVNEAAPALMRALAESIGVPIGALRELATNGQLTADVLSKAFGDENLLNKFREQAKEVQTLSGAWQGFKNKFVTYIGEMDKAVGGSKYLAKLLNFTGELLFPAEKARSAADDKRELEFLSKKGALGVREEARLQKLAALRQRMGINGNQLGGLQAITGGGNVAPNFTAAVEAQDINEIHRQQDEALRIRNDAAKKHADERRKINEALLGDIQDDINFEEEIKQVANTADIKRLKDIADLEKKEYERKAKQVELLQDQANKNYKEAQDLFLDAQREQLREFEKTVDGINQVFREGFANMVNGGKGSWKAFTTSLITTFKTAVADKIYKLLAEPFVVKLVASVLGVGASSAASAAGGALSAVGGSGGVAGAGGFSLGDAFSGVKALFSDTATSLISGIEGFGANIANGLGGIRDTVGGFIGANAGAIAQTLPYAGALLQLAQGNIKGAAFSAAGVAIGNAIVPVIGGVIGGIIGNFVGGLFGKKKIPLSSSQSIGQYSNGKFAPTSEGFFGKKNLGIASNLSGLNEAFSRSLGGLLNNFGLSDKVYTSSEINSRTNVRGSFVSDFEGGRISYGTKFGKAKRTSIEQAFNQLTDQVLGPLLVEAIQKSKLPDGIRALFNGVSDKAQVANLINATVMLNSAQEQLASRFGITVDQSAKAAKSTGLVGQALIDYVNKLASTAMSFQTIGDQLVKFRTSLEESYGGSLPATLKAYDEALKGIDKTTQEGIDSFVALFGIREQFAQFTASIDGLKGNVRGALFGMVSDAEKQQMLNADLAKLFGDLGRDVPGSIQELIALGKSIDYTTAEGLNLAAVFPSLVTAFNQTQTAVDELINSLNPNRFRTFFDFAVASSYVRQGIPLNQLPSENMPSYAVGTDYVPSDGPAIIHQGERIIPASQNASLTSDSNQMVSLLSTLVSKVSALEYDMGRAADGAQRTARELEDITGGDVTIITEAA
jgi:tape measure domain-containing protein